MARLPRLSAGGHLHLMIQRVQQGVVPFADPADRHAYLQCLAEAAASHSVAVHAYGLTAGEVRALATPPDAQALGRMIQHIGRRFAAAFNRRHGRRGALWEGRFRATILEPAGYFLPCLRFAEGAGEAARREAADDAPWSSADHHAGRRSDPFITEHAQFWALGNTPFEREAAYRAAMQQPGSAAEREGIALASMHGWVLGSDTFVQTLATQVNRRLRPLPPGRPAIRPRIHNN
jgi:putative transposase